MGTTLRMPCPLRTRVQHRYATDTSKVMSDIADGVSNKIKVKKYHVIALSEVLVVMHEKIS